VVYLLAAGFGLSLSIEFLTKPYRPLSIYGSGHSHAFEFVSDKAMKALQLSLEIARRPADVLKQLYDPQANSAYAVDPPRDGFWKGLWSDFRTTAIYRLFKDFERPSTFALATRDKTAAQWLAAVFLIIAGGGALLSALLTLPDSYINIHYLQQEKPYLAEIIVHVRSAAKTISNASGSAAFGIVLLSLIVIFLRRFLLVLTKLARAGLAWVIQRLLQGPGARVMGLVVRNAAFGGQCTQVQGPYQLPEKERARRETISHELNQRMNDLSTHTATRAGQAFYYALSEGDATQLRQHILARLTDPKLAHCQYYCEDEIVNRIADLIALPAPSTASADAQSVQSCHEAQTLAGPRLN
jgi:hypothetical protein